jgi:hypothetical protein
VVSSVGQEQEKLNNKSYHKKSIIRGFKHTHVRLRNEEQKIIPKLTKVSNSEQEHNPANNYQRINKKAITSIHATEK